MQMPEKVAKMSEERNIDFKLLDVLKKMKKTKKTVVKTLRKSLKQNGMEIKDVNKMIKRYNKISPQSTENLRDLLSSLDKVENYFSRELTESKDAIREFKRTISELKTGQTSVETKEKELTAVRKREKYYRELFYKLLPIKREDITMKQVDQRSDAHWQFERAQKRIQELEEEISVQEDRYVQVQHFYAQDKRSDGLGSTTSIHDTDTSALDELRMYNRSTSCTTLVGQDKEMQSEDIIRLDKATGTVDAYEKLDFTYMYEPNEEKRVDQETTSDLSDFYDQGDSANVGISALPCCRQMGDGTRI